MSQEKISVICKGDVIVSVDHLSLLYQQRSELIDALKGVMYWDNGKSEWTFARETIERIEANQ